MIISAQAVSKTYRLGEGNTAEYRTLRETINGGARRAVRSLRRFSPRGEGDGGAHQSSRPALKALDDVSFEINEGEAVGIIGHNGAGKSTLLKILSRITEPTLGRVKIQGRVGSLLEVGTGFHPELTGRENIFLNGAILGMSRREIRRSFDQIVDFAEVEAFLDTPVKRYSSGMYVRLAFSVAAHMLPDVLLIDEVLAVGDLGFQRKCLEHVRGLLQSNATVLLVSHNMFTVRGVCDRALYLNQGRIIHDGPIDRAIELYEEDVQASRARAPDQFRSDANGGQSRIELTSIECLDEQGLPRAAFALGERMRIRIGFDVPRPLENPCFIVDVFRSDKVKCCRYNTAMDGVAVPTLSGPGEIEVLTPPLELVSESYSLEVSVRDDQFHKLHCAKIGPSFQVRDEWLSFHFGVFRTPGEWTLRR